MGEARGGGGSASNNPETRSRRIPEEMAVAVVRADVAEGGLDAIELRTLNLLLGVAKRLGDAVRRWNESRGVPSFTQATLGALHACGREFGVSPTVLAAKLAITTGTMTHRLDALERHGFVRRRREERDGRRRLVVLTSKGHKALDLLRDQQIAFEVGLMRALKPSELLTLEALLLALQQEKPSQDEPG